MTAKKVTVSSLKGKSQKYLQTKDKYWWGKVEADAKRIANAKSDKTKNQKVIDKCDDFLQKTNGYNSAIDAYKSKESDLASAQKKLAKTKNKKTKAALTKKITSLKKEKKAIATGISKLSSSKGYQKQLAARKKANANIKNANKRIKSWGETKGKAKAKHTTYKRALAAAKAKANKKLQKKNSAKIQEKIKAHNKNHPDHTAIWREDLKTSDVFFFGEHEPSESNDQDTPTSTKDKSDPRSNYSVRTSKTLTGTYELFGYSFADCDKRFRKLQEWAKDSRIVAVRGFSKWKSAYMSNVTKSMSAPYRNVLPVSISFTYIKEAPITYTRKKSKAKTKAKLVIVKNKAGKYVVKTKVGKSLYAVSKDLKTTYKVIKQLNPKAIKSPSKAAKQIKVKK